MIAVLLISALLFAAFMLGRWIERTIIMHNLAESARAARAADQVALSEILRVMKGRQR